MRGLIDPADTESAAIERSCGPTASWPIEGADRPAGATIGSSRTIRDLVIKRDKFDAL